MPKDKDLRDKDSEEVLYEGGPVRVVTEEDIRNDSRLVGAGAVVGQLYDFSNLPHVKDGATEANVEAMNKAHADADKSSLRIADRKAARPDFTSEAERAKLGILSEEEKADREDRDEEIRKEVEKERKEAEKVK